MNALTVLCACFYLFGVVLTLDDEKGELERGYFKPEDGCSRKGGLCLHRDVCDVPVAAEPEGSEGMGCPLQAPQGAVCCQQLPTNETRCRKLGGECRAADDCKSKTALLTRAADCDNSSVCCLLS